MPGKTVRSDPQHCLGPAGRFSNLGFQAIPENRYNLRWYTIYARILGLTGESRLNGPRLGGNFGMDVLGGEVCSVLSAVSCPSHAALIMGCRAPHRWVALRADPLADSNLLTGPTSIDVLRFSASIRRTVP